MNVYPKLPRFSSVNSNHGSFGVYGETLRDDEYSTPEEMTDELMRWNDDTLLVITIIEILL